MPSQLRHKAIEFYRAGKVQAARDLLRASIQQTPRDELAWHWYVETCSTDDERRAVLESWLKADPHNRRAQAALSKLAGRPLRARWPSSAPLVLILAGILCVLWAAVYLAYTLAVFERDAQRIRYGTLQSERDQLEQEYRGLAANYQSLDSRHQGLATDYVSLQVQHGALVQEHNQLTTRYDSLMGQYGALQQAHDQLTAEHQSLHAEYQELDQLHSSLVAEYTSLRGKAITPPYVYIYSRTVEVAFVRLDQTIEKWEMPFATLEAEIENGYWIRDLHRDKIPMLNLRLDSKEIGRVMDFRPFVEPKLFGGVMPPLYKRSGSDAAFVKEVWNIVSQLTVYSDEIKETPRYPMETLLAGGGDCEDTAILYASMIKAGRPTWQVDLLYIDSDHPQSPETSNHVLVYLKTDRGKSYYIETTSDRNMEWPFAPKGWHFEVG